MYVCPYLCAHFAFVFVPSFTCSFERMPLLFFKQTQTVCTELFLFMNTQPVTNVCVCVSASIWSPGFSVHTDAGVEASVNSCCSVKLNVEHLRCHCICVKLGPSYHTLAIARFAADRFYTFCSDVHLPVKTPWNVRVLVNGICNSLTHDPSITGRVCLDRRIFHTSHNIVEICCSLSFMSGWT